MNSSIDIELFTSLDSTGQFLSSPTPQTLESKQEMGGHQDFEP